MGHAVEALLMGVGVYGGIAAAMLAVWGAAMTAIVGVTAIFRERGGAAGAVARTP